MNCADEGCLSPLAPKQKHHLQRLRYWESSVLQQFPSLFKNKGPTSSCRLHLLESNAPPISSIKVTQEDIFLGQFMVPLSSGPKFHREGGVTVELAIHPYEPIQVVFSNDTAKIFANSSPNRPSTSIVSPDQSHSPVPQPAIDQPFEHHQDEEEGEEAAAATPVLSTSSTGGNEIKVAKFQKISFGLPKLVAKD